MVIEVAMWKETKIKSQKEEYQYKEAEKRGRDYDFAKTSSRPLPAAASQCRWTKMDNEELEGLKMGRRLEDKDIWRRSQ